MTIQKITVKLEDGKEETAEIKRFGFKERNDLFRESMSQIKMGGLEPQFTLDPWKLQEQAIFKGIVSAWFPITKENVEKLDFQVAEQIYNQIAELNNLGSNTTKKPE